MADIVTRLPGFLRPDAARTVLRSFIVEDPSTSDCPRTLRIIDGILALDDAELRDQLKVLAAGLNDRHRDVDRLLRRRYEELSGLMTDRAPATPDERPSPARPDYADAMLSPWHCAQRPIWRPDVAPH